jgi:hypothetical protein
VRAFDVDLDLRVGAERADDDVLLEVTEFVRVHALPAGDLPDPRVVERELLRLVAAEPVDPAVADMPDPGALGPEEQRHGGRTEPAELRVLLADLVDAGVRLVERLADGDGDPVPGVLVEDLGDVADGLGAGLLPDGVPAHPVGHDEHVPVVPPVGLVRGRVRRAAVLVVAPLHAHVGQGGEADGFKSRQRSLGTGARGGSTVPVDPGRAGGYAATTSPL